MTLDETTPAVMKKTHWPKGLCLIFHQYSNEWEGFDEVSGAGSSRSKSLRKSIEKMDEFVALGTPNLDKLRQKKKKEKSNG